MKEGSVIEIDYTGKAVLTGNIFESTIEKKAIAAGIFSEKGQYKPMVVVVGEGHVLPGLEKALKEKQVLKESMRGFLPGSICRREKQPLQPPGKWFIDSASELVSEYLSENVVREKGYFNPRFIEKVLREYGNGGRGDYSGVVVVALFVHLWDEIFMQ